MNTMLMYSQPRVGHKLLWMGKLQYYTNIWHEVILLPHCEVLSYHIN